MQNSFYGTLLCIAEALGNHLSEINLRSIGESFLSRQRRFFSSQLKGVEYHGNDIRTGGFPDQTSNIPAKR